MASFDENGKYIKTNWKAGDKITSTKLNKIEESIEAVNDNDISRHVEADSRLDALEAKDVEHDKELTKIKNTIADNKAAAELGDYDINSRMTFLEEELNEGIEEVHNVADTVDGKIAKAESDMTNAVNTAKEDMRIQVGSAMNVMDTAKNEMTTQVITAKNEMTAQVNAAKAEMAIQVNQGKADMEAKLAEVEDKIAAADANMTAQVNSAKSEVTSQLNSAMDSVNTTHATMVSMVDYVDTEIFTFENQVNKAKSDITAQVNQGKADIDAKLAEFRKESNIPSYVITEAQNVAEKVIEARNAYSIVISSMSDLHTTGSDTSATGVLHAFQGINEIDKITPVDLVAIHGDVMVGYMTDEYKGAFKYVRTCMNEITKNIPLVHMQGNHDDLTSDTTEIARQKYFRYIGANNEGTITDFTNRFRNYGYKDFDDLRIRFIYLNSVDASEFERTSSEWITPMQFNWFINTALDFSNKEGSEDWQWIVACHHPLNTGGITQYLLNILKAYTTKTSGSFDLYHLDVKHTISYDFTNVKQKFICHLHGHIHNFRTEWFDDVLSITVPNACYGRNNEYGTHSSYNDETHEKFGDIDENGQQRQFNKTSNTANDTAFIAFVIDSRVNNKIYAYCYGAGIDREIDLITKEVKYIDKPIEDTPDIPDIPDTPDTPDTPSEPSKPTNLLVISDRTYETFSTDTANFREVTVPHELTTDKYYSAMYDGKIGKYCASKITFTPNAEVNGFTFKTSSATGYGPLFPLSITSEGKYWIKLACTGIPIIVEIVEYDSNKLYKGRTRLSGGLSGDGVEYQVDFDVTDTSSSYAVYFTVGSPNINKDCIVTNLYAWKA